MVDNDNKNQDLVLKMTILWISCNCFVIYRRVKKLLESSSNIALGGDSNAQDRYISPTVLADVTFKDSVMQEEVSMVYVLK